MQRRVFHLIFACLGLTLPAGAASYNYYLQVSAAGGFNAWSVSWRSSSLTIPTCPASATGDITAFLVSDPPGGDALASLSFCSIATISGALPIAAARFGGPLDSIGYQVNFSITSPPVNIGVFSSASGVATLGPEPSANPSAPVSATLTISEAAAGPPIPRWLGAIIRATLTVAGPVTPLPGTPVEANVGFVDINGNSLGQFPPVQIIPGQAMSFELSPTVSSVAAGQHTQVVPVVTAPEGKALPPLQLTTEVFDSSTGYGAVLTNLTGLAPPPASFAPQGLAGGQTMRLTATAFSTAPCFATLSFANAQGIAIGPSLTVNLDPGHSQSLELTAAMLNMGVGTNAIVQPMAKLQVPVGTAALTGESGCMVSSDVFDPTSGRTSTYQIANVQ